MHHWWAVKNDQMNVNTGAREGGGEEEERKWEFNQLMVDASAFTIQSFRVNQSPMVWIHMNECSFHQSHRGLVLLPVSLSFFCVSSPSPSTVRSRTASLFTYVACVPCKHTIEYQVMRIKDQVCMFNPLIWWQSKASTETVTSSVFFFFFFFLLRLRLHTQSAVIIISCSCIHHTGEQRDEGERGRVFAFATRWVNRFHLRKPDFHILFNSPA